MFDEKESHESFGLVGFSRVTSTPPVNFFGSSIRSGHYVVLRVKRAERARDLSNYWYHSLEPLIQIRLSPNQFAELLTTMNVGDGVPCTIEAVGYEQMPPCPAVDQRAKYEDEFKKHVADTAAEAVELRDYVTNLFFEKERLSKQDRLDIKKRLDLLVQQIKSNTPFIQSQFNEAMDKTVAEAKGEVEAFVNHKIHSLGIQALNSEVGKALEAPLESEPFLLKESNE